MAFCPSFLSFFLPSFLSFSLSFQDHSIRSTCALVIRQLGIKKLHVKSFQVISDVSHTRCRLNILAVVLARVCLLWALIVAAALMGPNAATKQLLFNNMQGGGRRGGGRLATAQLTSNGQGIRTMQRTNSLRQGYLTICFNYRYRHTRKLMPECHPCKGAN